MTSYIEIPVVRDRQGGQDFYTGAIKSGLLTRIAIFADPDLPPEERAQRAVDPKHAQEIAKYILDNPDNYTFSNIEITILGKATIKPVGDDFAYLKFEEGISLLFNDGQHRTEGFRLAILQRPDVARDGVKVSFVLDPDLDRARQRFADLNGNGKAVSKALNLLYDHRDPEAGITRSVVARIPLLKALVECEQNSLPKASRKLFTLNGFHEANAVLLCGQEDLKIDQQIDLAVRFWSQVIECMPDWDAVYQKTALASEVRSENLHCQAISLIAIAKVGAFLLTRHPKNWQEKLTTLKQVDWNRQNPVWQGRVIFDRSIKKTNRTILGAVCYLKQSMGLDLNADEQAIESQLSK